MFYSVLIFAIVCRVLFFRVLESRNGFQLLCLADIHLGCVVSVLSPHRMLGDPLLTSASVVGDLSQILTQKIPSRLVQRTYGTRLDKSSSSKSSLVVGSTDGSLGLVVPVDERTYRRLALLQQIMGMAIEASCGLNPREFRILKTKRFQLEKKKGVLDGNLLWLFITLERSLQDELTAAMGTTVDIVLDNLLEIDLLNTFF